MPRKEKNRKKKKKTERRWKILKHEQKNHYAMLHVKPLESQRHITHRKTKNRRTGKTRHEEQK
jgi:hypothetical protein